MQPLSWTVLEFEERERHPDWLWYAGLVFAIGATLAFFYGDIFFGIFLCLAGISVIMFAMRTPRLLHISLNEKDLIIDNERITYDRVKQFWIDESAKPDKLLLLVKGSFVPMIAVPLAGVTVDTIRTQMTMHAPEIEMHESLGTKIAERLGF